MKPKRLIGVCVTALAVAGLFAALELRAKNWEERWRAFTAEWESKGENFDPAAHLPPDLGKDREFAGHPWICRVVEQDRGVLETLERMKPAHVAGYVDWECATDENGIPHPMPPELARRIVHHARAFHQELDAFGEAVRRPGCRLASGTRSFTDELASVAWTTKLTPVKELLGASAHAAATLGDRTTLGRDLETLLLAGNLLRSSNFSLGVVVGCGFESAAFDVIRSLPDPAKWPVNERRQWIAALNLRVRTPADEFASTHRLERGIFLQQIDEFSANSQAPVVSGLERYGPFRRAFLARARLAACEALQGMVLAENGKLCTRIEPQRITRYQDHLKALRGAPDSRKSKLHPADDFGMLPQFLFLGIHEALILHEADRAAVLERIKLTDN